MIDFVRAFAAAVFLIAAMGLCACGRTSVPYASGVSPQLGAMHEAAKAKGCLTPPCIYVSNNGTSPGGITIYKGSANGDVSPIETISGRKTGIMDAYGVALDPARNIYVANFGPFGSVTEYAAGSDGDVRPTRTLTNAPNGKHLMLDPSDVVADSAGNIYVTAVASDSVSVYGPDASGYDKPLRYIHGGNTQMDAPTYLARTKDGGIFVANFHGDSVTVYARKTDGNVAPVRMIAGTRTKLSGCSGLALDSKGDIYVSNGNAGSVTVFSKDANGDAAPIRIISGPATGLANPDGIAIDANDNIYVTNALSQSGGSITVYPKGANGNVAPSRKITGPKTLLDIPSGLVVQ